MRQKFSTEFLFRSSFGSWGFLCSWLLFSSRLLWWWWCFGLLCWLLCRGCCCGGRGICGGFFFRGCCCGRRGICGFFRGWCYGGLIFRGWCCGGFIFRGWCCGGLGSRCRLDNIVFHLVPETACFPPALSDEAQVLLIAGVVLIGEKGNGEH